VGPRDAAWGPVGPSVGQWTCVSRPEATGRLYHKDNEAVVLLIGCSSLHLMHFRCLQFSGYHLDALQASRRLQIAIS
jgi:hypothetical protein